jgi:hypothetical protein
MQKNHGLAHSVVSLLIGLCACGADVPEAGDVQEAEETDAIGASSQALQVNIGSVLGSPVFEGDTCSATNDTGVSCSYRENPEYEIVWTAPATGDYVFSTTSDWIHFRHALDVQAPTWSTCAPSTPATPYGEWWSSSVKGAVSQGAQVKIVVEGMEGSWYYGCGPIALSITKAPAPAPAPTPILWLSGDSGVTTSNGRVSSWQDKSGKGNNASMTTASRQPYFVNSALNGTPVVRFQGAQSLVLTNLLKPSKFSVFVVGKNNKLSESFSMILGPANVSANNQLRWENGSQALFVGTGNNLPVAVSSIGNTRVYHALSATYDGSSMKVYRDGNPTSTHSFTTSGPWDLYQIGAYYSSYFMDGDVAEIVFYDRALTESERTNTNAYLKGKYALP